MSLSTLFKLSFNVPEDIHWLVYKLYFTDYILSEIKFKRYRDLSEWSHVAPSEAEMLSHMYTAISDCEMWGVLRIQNQIQNHKGIIHYPDHESLSKQFDNAMLSHPLVINDWHNDITFYFCLDTMNRILKQGFEAYVKEYNEYIKRHK